MNDKSALVQVVARYGIDKSHSNSNVVMLKTFSSLATLEAVMMMTTSDQKAISMMTFLFPYIALTMKTNFVHITHQASISYMAYQRCSEPQID